METRVTCCLVKWQAGKMLVDIAQVSAAVNKGLSISWRNASILQF